MTHIWIGPNGLSVSEESQAVARKSIVGQTSQYFVRATVGGQLFNPIDGRASLTEKDKERGGPRYALRRCSAPTYQKYIDFLSTRNKANLLVAERTFNDECR